MEKLLMLTMKEILIVKRELRNLPTDTMALEIIIGEAVKRIVEYLNKVCDAVD